MSDPISDVTAGLLGSEGGVPANLAHQYRFTIRYSVAARLLGKVRIQQGPEAKAGELALLLMDEIVTDVEDMVERRLGGRYKTPLAADYAAFTQLPSMTQSAIRSLVNTEASARILAITHGRQVPAKGNEFHDQLRVQFDRELEALLDMTNPPLAGLTALHRDFDDARPSGIAVGARGFNTGLREDEDPRKAHPTDSVLGRLPRSDVGW